MRSSPVVSVCVRGVEEVIGGEQTSYGLAAGLDQDIDKATCLPSASRRNGLGQLLHVVIPRAVGGFKMSGQGREKVRGLETTRREDGYHQLGRPSRRRAAQPDIGAECQLHWLSHVRPIVPSGEMTICLRSARSARMGRARRLRARGAAHVGGRACGDSAVDGRTDGLGMRSADGVACEGSASSAPPAKEGNPSPRVIQ